jgi:hypothetical protein
MTMNSILLNIPLGVAMVAFTVGLPAWVMWKFPEGNDNSAAQLAAQPNRDHIPSVLRSTHHLSVAAGN